MQSLNRASSSRRPPLLQRNGALQRARLPLLFKNLPLHFSKQTLSFINGTLQSLIHPLRQS
jgi:hypothetical protein